MRESLKVILIMRNRFGDSVMVEPEGIPVGLQGIPYIRFSEDAKDGMAIDFSAGVDQPEVMNAEDDHYVAVLRPPSIEKLFTGLCQSGLCADQTRWIKPARVGPRCVT